jgi:uncharacterized protein YlxW (UPF0749 family)
MTLTIDEKFALLEDMKVIDNNRKIVERLKKRIEELDEQIEWEFTHENNVDADGEDMLKELQEILGEKK